MRLMEKPISKKPVISQNKFRFFMVAKQKYCFSY
jgi:hypothetical protein